MTFEIAERHQGFFVITEKVESGPFPTKEAAIERGTQLMLESITKFVGAEIFKP